MENRNGLAVNSRLTQGHGRAEPSAALEMVEEILGLGRVTLGADKGYDRKEFVRELRDHNVTPHIAQRQYSAIDQRTSRHGGYAISQTKRKRVEEIFGWMKSWGGLRRTRFRGIERVQLHAHFVGAAYNLLRLSRLRSAPA